MSKRKYVMSLYIYFDIFWNKNFKITLYIQKFKLITQAYEILSGMFFDDANYFKYDSNKLKKNLTHTL
jgi:hypothetical protein